MMEHWEKIVEGFYGKHFAPAANGTTAMYLLFRALGLQRKKVLFPAISCTSPVNAAVFAGYAPCFVDVGEGDYTIDLDAAEKILGRGDVGVMVPTHIYGHLYDREKARYIARKHQVFLFEDGAQTVDVGESDAAVVSFGHTKIFEAGTGGGILSEDLSLAEKIRQEGATFCAKEKPPADDAFDAYRGRYYAIVQDGSLTESECYKRLHELQLDSRKHFLSTAEPDGEAISRRLSEASNIIKSRIEKALLYKEMLNKDFVSLPKVDFSTVAVWRFTFLAKHKRDAVLEAVRQKGIDISSWYLPLHKIYETVDHCPVAEYVADHVVNLWVDESRSLDYIRRECGVLNMIFKEV